MLHAKLKAINIFNRLSLLANQLPPPVKVNQTQITNCNESLATDHVKINDTLGEKADVVIGNLFKQKFIVSSSLQLYEDDLSRIDVKSLVSKISSSLIWDGFSLSLLSLFQIFYR